MLNEPPVIANLTTGDLTRLLAGVGTITVAALKQVAKFGIEQAIRAREKEIGETTGIPRVSNADPEEELTGSLAPITEDEIEEVEVHLQ